MDQGTWTTAVPIVATRAGVILGRSDGVEIRTLKEGGLHRQHHPLDGLQGRVLAADRRGKGAYVAQGRWIWRWRAGRFSRVAQGPGGTWHHLATHPDLAGWLIGGDGRELYRSFTGGRRWERVRLELGELGELLHARFAACPRPRPSRPRLTEGDAEPAGRLQRPGPRPPRGRQMRPKGLGDLLVVGNGGLWWIRDGEEPRRLRTTAPVRALVEAHPEDPNIYVVADRLYRWSCGQHASASSPQETAPAPEILDVPASDVVTLKRDPALPGRLWLLGRVGLRALDVAGEHGGHTPRGGQRTGGADQDIPERAIEVRTSLQPTRNAAGRGGSVTDWHGCQLASSAGRPPARLADYLPVVILSAVGFTRLGGALNEKTSARLRRHRRQRFGFYLSLRWPLGTPPAQRVEREALLALDRRATRERLLRRMIAGILPTKNMAWSHGEGIQETDPDLHGALSRWAAAQERAALERFFRNEDPKPPHRTPRQKEKP